MVSFLLSLSLQNSEVTESKDAKAEDCPHCSYKRIRANGTLQGVQLYDGNACKKSLARL